MGQRTNLVPNGGFETNTTGYSGYNATLTRVTSEQLFGLASMKMEAVGGGFGFGYTAVAYAELKAGQIVTSSVYVKGEGSGIGETWVISLRHPATGWHGDEPSIVLTSEWQRITVTDTIPEDGVYSVWSFGGDSPAEAGDVAYIDGVQLEYGPVATYYIETDGAPSTVGGTRTNLIPNGGFETDTSTWTNYGVATTISRDTSEHRYGVASCKVAAGASGTMGAEADPITVPILPGDTFTVSVWLKGEGAAIGHHVQFFTQLLQVEADETFISADLTLTGTWARHSFIVTATRTHSLFKQFLVNGTTSAPFDVYYFDGAQLEVGLVATEYIETDGAAVTVTDVIPALISRHSTGMGRW